MSKTTIQDAGPAAGKIKLSELNALLRHCGVRRTAEVLVSLLGIVGLNVLALEASK